MGDRKADPRTVFVRGVDAAVTDVQLQEFFSELGPVKKAFLVRKGGRDGAHRGFGFVQFAVQEDAVRAAAELHGAELAGRKLKVEGAVKRAPLEERKKRKQDASAGAPAAAAPAGAAPSAGEQLEQQPPAKKPRPARPAAAPRDAAKAAVQEAKHKWLRAVAVGGLTPEAVDAAVAMAKAAGKVEEVVRPVPDKLAAQFMLKRDGCTGESFLAVYPSVKDAMAAVPQLHGKPVAGQQGKKGKAAAGGEGGGACTVWARQLSGDGLHQKRWRLIVRNLTFTATEAELRTAFSPAGFVWEVTVPRSATGRGRGFAFVGFTCKTHAERAIRLVNGQPVAGRPVAVDWAVAKAQFDTQQAAAEGGEGGGAAEEGARQRAGIDGLDSDSEEEGAAGGERSKMGHEEEGPGRAAAVAPEQERHMLASVIDGILGSSDEEEEGEESGEEEEGSDDDEFGQELGQSGGSDESGDEEEEEGEEEEAGSSGDEGDGQEAGGVSEGEEAQAAAPAAPAAGSVDPFSRAQLQHKAAAAAAAAQGVDAPQQRQRAEPEEGATVFIRSLPLDVTKEQVFQKMKAFGPVRSCRLVVDKESGKLKGTAFVDFYKLASAQAAAEACAKGRRKEGTGVVIAGLVADVDLALGQEDVRALAVAKSVGKGGTASRRLALAKEGQIAEGSPAWEDMSAGDRAKRKRAAEEKKLKLKSPNFVVSDTRLSVRNIPPSWTEKQLKQAFIQAVKERATKAQPVAKQVKILLDEERTAADGAPRSKGIGFVEFADPEHALVALRQLNNNPATFSKDKRPVVEFALDNVKALKLRESKLAKAKQGQQGSQPQQQQQQEGEPAQQGAASGGKGHQVQRGGDEEADGEQEEAAPKSKRKLRKERSLMLRERRKQQKAGAGEGGSAAPAANGVAAAEGDMSKSAKRREQRKRKQMEVQGVAVDAASAPAAAMPKQQQQGKPKQASHQQAKQEQQQGKPQHQPGKQQPGKQQQQQQEGKPQQGKQHQPGKPQQDKQQHEKPGVNSRAARAQAASQQEQQSRQRKRSADDLVDLLAGSGSQGAPQAHKKKSKKEETDSVDALAKRYLSKFFDAPAAKTGGEGGSKAPAAGAQAAQRAALKRWFE